MATATTLPKVSIEVEQIDPATAEKMLESNTHNRTLRRTDIALYARDMAAGKWQVTGEAVKFDRDGRMIDGQHRLHAVIRAAVTVPMLVIRGLDPQSQDVMDTGRRRNASDAITLRGDANGTRLAAAARLHKQMTDGTLSSRYTNSELIAHLDAHPEIRTAVEAVAAYRVRIAVPQPILAYAWTVLAKIDATQTEAFFNSLASKATNGDGDPRSALLQRLDHARYRKEQVSVNVHVAWIFRTWNAWRTGGVIHKLAARTAGIDGVVEVSIPTPR